MEDVVKKFRDSKAKSRDCDIIKRLRCINFSSQEKNILIHIIEKYPDIIECKKTDKFSVQQRDSVWEAVTQEFNDIFLNETVRTTKQLRMCYDNLKRRIKKEGSSDESKRSKTDINGVLSQVLDQSNDSDSSTRLNGANSSFHGSIDQDTPAQFQSDAYSMAVYDNQDSELMNDEPRRKDATFEKLRRTLLHKQIMSAELDLEMKAKKYEIEIKVEQAKLEYYRKKCSLLDNQKTIASTRNQVSNGHS